MVAGVTSSAGPRRMSALMVAAESGSLEAVTAVMKALPAIPAGAKAIVSAYTGSVVSLSERSPFQFVFLPNFHFFFPFLLCLLL